MTCSRPVPRSNGVLAHGHLPCCGRRARGERVRQRHLYWLCAGLPEESRISSKTKASFSSRTFGSRFRRHGLRSGLQGSCDRGRSDGSRTHSNGLLSDSYQIVPEPVHPFRDKERLRTVTPAQGLSCCVVPSFSSEFPDEYASVPMRPQTAQ
jgi:hypothetical protein